MDHHQKLWLTHLPSDFQTNTQKKMVVIPITKFTAIDQLDFIICSLHDPLR